MNFPLAEREAHTIDRPPAIHRALSRFPVDRRGLIAGVSISGVIVAAGLAFAHAIWRAEALGLKMLLRLSQTPFRVLPPPNPAPGLLGGTIKGGATFVVPTDPHKIPLTIAIAAIAALMIVGIIAIRWSKVAVPAKVLLLLFATLGIASVWYAGFISGVPPQPVDSLTIGFQKGGLLAIIVAVVLFAFEVFPVPGRLRFKLSWLFGLVIFSFAWSVVRMAFVLATAHHVGAWTFLYLQYIAGPIVDFLSVVAIYSLVTHGLAKRLHRYIA